ncbi:hypothetical protein LCGC14_2729980, partial [marine sediment metagenome]
AYQELNFIRGGNDEALQNAIFQIGSDLKTQERWVEALHVLETFVDSFPRHAQAGQALTMVGQIHQTNEAWKDAIAAYRRVIDEVENGQWFSRAEIETGELLKDRGLEIAWIDDPVDVFFLQIQGSGRVNLADGGALRVGYGGKNGHEYRSIGQELVRRGVYEAHEVSAQVIRNWVRENPEEGAELLRHNPSFVFFREVSQVPAHRGPLGAMNRSITTLRSVAVDPSLTPLGAPVWIEKAGAEPMHRLMIAQDTGSAIKGAQRADIFFGTGKDAGRAAGQIRDTGRMVVLMPIQRAYALLPGF